VQHRQALLVDRVDVRPVLFQQEGQVGVAPEDRVVDGREALVVLPVHPLLLPLGAEGLWLCRGLPVVALEEEGDDFVVVVVGTHMQQSGVLAVEHLVDPPHALLEQLLRLLVVEALHRLEQLLIGRLCHL
jgi:hypothetical protein